MKIDNLRPPGPLPGEQGKTNGATRASAPRASDADSLSSGQLSREAQDASHDIDAARVEEIRAAIREGRLPVRADAIADALIASVRSLLEGKTP